MYFPIYLLMNVSKTSEAALVYRHCIFTWLAMHLGRQYLTCRCPVIIIWSQGTIYYIILSLNRTLNLNSV